jgi:hypothetical protein
MNSAAIAMTSRNSNVPRANAIRVPKENASMFEFSSLCLSRACLGKRDYLQYRMAQKDMRFLAVASVLIQTIKATLERCLPHRLSVQTQA